MASLLSRLTKTDWILIVFVAIATISGGFLGPAWVVGVAVAVIFLAACATPPDKLVLWYVATLPLIVPQGVIAMRLSLADLFAIPLVARAALAVVTGKRIQRSSMLAPLALIAVAFIIATFVGRYQVGRFTTYAIINKDIGIAFQTATYLALLVFVRTREDVLAMARAFVAGVGIANATALVAVVTSFAGANNVVYLVSNGRFYGWMEQPTVHGGLLMAAAMIEFGLLRTERLGRDMAALHWVNLLLLALGLGLTLSRGSWSSVSVGAATMLVAFAWFDRNPAPLRRWSVLTMVVLWCIVPGAVVGQIFLANLNARLFHDPAQRAAQIRAVAMDTCKADPTLEMCQEQKAMATSPAANDSAPASAGGSPGAPPTAAGSPAATPAAASPSGASSAALPEPNSKLYGAMMNARGLDDRMAITYVAWRAFAHDRWSKLLGIGLGTFYARSARDFGVAVIIHNTFEWFLVELGPLGLMAVLWFWLQTIVNAYVAARDDKELRFVAIGAVAAFAGLTFFCLTNEGFYQRQLWLVAFLLDRARALSLQSTAASALSPFQSRSMKITDF